MLKCEILEIHGFPSAIEGMRNPMNSWSKSDSEYRAMGKHYEDIQWCIGDNDLNLMKKLFTAGTEHRKYLRMIQVWMNITAPLYWWKEFDTYKIGTVANSCSTMHKIHSKEFTMEDFSVEHLGADCLVAMKNVIYELNRNRINFLATNDKQYWWNIIQLLPSAYNQKRTVMMNYEVVARIIEQRSGHKLDEWNFFVDRLINLPHIKEIIK